MKFNRMVAIYSTRLCFHIFSYSIVAANCAGLPQRTHVTSAAGARVCIIFQTLLTMITARWFTVCTPTEAAGITVPSRPQLIVCTLPSESTVMELAKSTIMSPCFDVLRNLADKERAADGSCRVFLLKQNNNSRNTTTMNK